MPDDIYIKETPSGVFFVTIFSQRKHSDPLIIKFLSKNNKFQLFFKKFFRKFAMSKLKKTSYGDRKIIRMLAVFIVVTAFALSVAARLLFPEASHLSDTPLLVLLILSVCAIWRDALRSEKQNDNTNE